MKIPVEAKHQQRLCRGGAAFNDEKTIGEYSPK